MASIVGPMYLAPTGTTGNNTHVGVRTGPDFDNVAFKFVVEAVGATPTVTWKIQGSFDDETVADANASWFDIAYFTDATDTPAVATRTATAVGAQASFMDSANNCRFYRRYRVVTSANTNVTYRVEAYALNR